MKVDPIKWVRLLMAMHGVNGAFDIVERSAQPLGQDQSVRNPHADFYETALKWLKKNYKRSAVS